MCSIGLQIANVKMKHGIYFKSLMKVQLLSRFLNYKCLLLSLRIKRFLTFSFFYSELSDIINSLFNLGEPILDPKVVRKTLKSLRERFKLKVTTIEDSKDINSMRVDELVGSIQTYEMSLPRSQKPKDFTFKASENEKKDIEINMI